jgi:hypothetical protein
MNDWQQKVLEKWRENSRKTDKQRKADMEAAEAARIALDERFFTAYPHLRPTSARLAALRDGKCAHCAAAYPVWEHVAHFYCSRVCALREEALSS